MTSIVYKVGLSLMLLVSKTLAQNNDLIIQDIYADSIQQTEQGKLEAKKLLDSIDLKRIKLPEDPFFKLNDKPNKMESANTNSNNPCAEKICKAQVINLQQPVQQNVQENESSTLLVFVTLSMTDETLRSLSREVAKYGGRVIIRGLVDDSFQKTQKRLLALGINVDIDPPLFEQFDVRDVPTFVHVKVERGEYSNSYDLLKGNVTLTYALEQFTEHGSINTQHLLNNLSTKQLRGCL